MSKELDALYTKNRYPSTNECLLKTIHDDHYWWYTSSGGGHMLGGAPTEDDLKHERGLKLHWCPGKATKTMETETINRIVTSSGWTESFNDDDVRVMLNLGLIYHAKTELYDDHVTKVYDSYQMVSDRPSYKVSDYRSSTESTLEEQYPQHKN